MKHQKIITIKHLNKTNMKGTLHKTEQGWIVIYDEGTGINKNQNSLPLVDNGHIDGLKLYDSNKGLEVDFEILTDYDNNGPNHFPKFARIIIPKLMILTPEEAELKDWDVTLMDGLENEPYVSDDFQIGPDGAYEHTEDWNTLPRERASELIVDYQIKVKSLDYNEAKQCVLVMVDEIKKILYSQDLMIRYDYWTEVKKEIEKL